MSIFSPFSPFGKSFGSELRTNCSGQAKIQSFDELTINLKIAENQ
jgi:hypothetical protein